MVAVVQRPRSQIKRSSRYDYSPLAKRRRCSEADGALQGRQKTSDEGIGPTGGAGPSGKGGRQLTSNGRRQTVGKKGKGAKGQSVSGQKGKSTATKDDLPLSAISIKVKEKAIITQDEFCPLREPGIYLPDMDVTF